MAEFKAAKDRSKGEILHCKLTFKKKLFRESDEAVADPMFVQLSYVQVRNTLRIIVELLIHCFINSVTIILFDMLLTCSLNKTIGNVALELSMLNA